MIIKDIVNSLKSSGFSKLLIVDSSCVDGGQQKVFIANNLQCPKIDIKVCHLGELINNALRQLQPNDSLDRDLVEKSLLLANRSELVQQNREKIFSSNEVDKDEHAKTYQSEIELRADEGHKIMKKLVSQLSNIIVNFSENSCVE